MDESAVSFHTPETKQQSKQWVKKGQPGPLKEGACFEDEANGPRFLCREGRYLHEFRAEGRNSQSLLHPDCPGQIPERQKRQIMAAQDWWLHWDNAPGHTAATVADFLAAKRVKSVPHPPYSPDLAPADFFLFPKVKAELAGQMLMQETFKNSWEGVVRSIAKEDFATAFRRWKERCKKCIRVGGNYVEK
jgi:histone-lysine N-methyltransferase SETMAR